MTKPWKPNKKTVELRPPSRIRRDPARTAEAPGEEKELNWCSSEREIKLAIFGIVLFALAIDIIIVSIGR